MNFLALREWFRTIRHGIFKPPRLVLAENARLPLIFVHIPRTAGTSFQKVLNRVGVAGEIALHETDDRIARAATEDPDYFTRFKGYTGHITVRSLDYFPKSASTLVFLRHPVGHAASLHNLLRSLAPNLPDLADATRYLVELAMRLPVEDFVALPDEDVARYMRNPQCRYLTRQPWAYPFDDNERLDEAIETLSSFDFIGITERFGEALMLFEKRYLASRIRKFDIANVLSDKHTVASERLAAAVAEVSALDFKLYEHACRMFDDQLKADQALPDRSAKVKLPYGVVVR